MQRILWMVCAGLLLVFARAADAQIIADMMVNYPMPTGDFADIADQGFGVAGDVYASLPLLPIKIGGHAGYTRFAEADGGAGGDTSIVELVPSIRYQLGLPFDLLSFWAQFGAGMYRWENDADNGADFGMAAGVGVSVMVLPSIHVVAMPLYHVIKRENENLTYVTANVGIRF